MRYYQKEGKPCGVLPSSDFIFTARSCRNHTPPSGCWKKKTSHPNAWDTTKYEENHVAFSVFFVSCFSQPASSRTPFLRFFWWSHLRSQNLPEAYSWMTGKNQPKPETFQKPIPEWDTQKGTKTMWPFNFFRALLFTTRTFQNHVSQWDRQKVDHDVALSFFLHNQNLLRTYAQDTREQSVALQSLSFTAKTLPQPAPAKQNHAAF